MTEIGRRLGGNRVFTVAHAIAQRARNMKPRTRRVQLNPIDWNNRVIIIGKTTPARDDPEFTIPNIVPRRLWNQAVVEVRLALKTAPDPIELNRAGEMKI